MASNFNPNPALLGAFGVEKGVTKFPYTARMGTGKGQKITNITDGTSTTVMFAEIDTFDTPTSPSRSYHCLRLLRTDRTGISGGASSIWAWAAVSSPVCIRRTRIRPT